MSSFKNSQVAVRLRYRRPWWLPAAAAPSRVLIGDTEAVVEDCTESHQETEVGGKKWREILCTLAFHFLVIPEVFWHELSVVVLLLRWWFGEGGQREGEKGDID